ncbi:MAG: pyridoxamine 5'-phosphate oxidase family protein [Actinomycetota bacterium]
MRSLSERKAHAVARLEGDTNVWVATGSADGVPHMVPLSLAWDGTRVLVATPTDSPTVRNAAASGLVKAALDSADDVVLIDGTVDVVDFARADPAEAHAYVTRVGWNPADQDGDWSLLRIQPRTIRVWNGVAEIQGRTILRGGAWLD